MIPDGSESCNEITWSVNQYIALFIVFYSRGVWYGGDGVGVHNKEEKKNTVQ